MSRRGARPAPGPRRGSRRARTRSRPRARSRAAGVASRSAAARTISASCRRRAAGDRDPEPGRDADPGDRHRIEDQDRGADATLAQLDRLVHRRHAEPVGAGCLERGGDGNRSVAVGVGLDHGPDGLARTGQRAHDAEIGPRVRRGRSRAMRSAAAAATPRRPVATRSAAGPWARSSADGRVQVRSAGWSAAGRAAGSVRLASGRREARTRAAWSRSGARPPRPAACGPRPVPRAGPRRASPRPRTARARCRRRARGGTPRGVPPRTGRGPVRAASRSSRTGRRRSRRWRWPGSRTGRWPRCRRAPR